MTHPRDVRRGSCFCKGAFSYVHLDNVVRLGMIRQLNSRKLALFVPDLRGGGAERVMLVLAGAFAGRGFDVDLVLARAVGEYLSHVPENVRLVDLQAPRLRTTPARLARYLRQVRPAALLSAYDQLNLLAIVARQLSRIKPRLVCTVHVDLSTHLKLEPRTFRKRTYASLLRAMLYRADHVVCVSQGVADSLVTRVGVSPDHVSVIYNPVSIERIRILAEEPVDHPWFQEGAPPVILGVGRLDPQKDYPTLMRAFALLRKKQPTRLVILGEGRERAHLERLARELSIKHDVWLPGFVENPYKYMKRCSVLALSSRWEGFSLALVEGMALGVSVVSTDCPSGPREVLEGGKWGRLVPVGDCEALARALEEALRAPIVAPPETLERFNVERVASQYLKVLGLE